MSARWLVVLALAAGCKDKAPPAESTQDPRLGEISGTLFVDKKPVGQLACRPGAAVHIFVEVVSPAGVLRFEDQKLSWKGEPLTCKQLDRSWGGGRRPNNEAYWRGTLAFDCVAGETTVSGNLLLDCGRITPEERAQLDANRKKLQDEQRDAGP